MGWLGNCLSVLTWTGQAILRRMANYRTPDPDLLDRGFNALADATRRGIIAPLSEGEASVTDLAAGYDMALPG